MLTSRAIVLSRENFGEADCYLQMLSEEWGMITVLAKSARKSRRRYVGGLDIFCHNEISLRGSLKETPYLEELKVLNAFLGLREVLERAFAAGRLVHWVQKLNPAATPVPDIYRLLGQSLALMEKESSEERLALLELLFKVKLLACLGLKPRSEACLQEECPGREFYFDLPSGAVLCARCSQGKNILRQHQLTLDQKNFLQSADALRPSQWDQIQFPAHPTAHLNRLVSQFASFHTHVYLPL